MFKAMKTKTRQKGLYLRATIHPQGSDGLLLCHLNQFSSQRGGDWEKTINNLRAASR